MLGLPAEETSAATDVCKCQVCRLSAVNRSVCQLTYGDPFSLLACTGDQFSSPADTWRSVQFAAPASCRIVCVMCSAEHWARGPSQEPWRSFIPFRSFTAIPFSRHWRRFAL